MRTSLAVAAATFTCLAAVASPVSAASISSLQSQLNKALVGLPDAPSLQVQAEATITANVKKMSSGETAKEAFHFTFATRKQPVAVAQANTEGRFVLDTFDTTFSANASPEVQRPLKLDGPIVLQWKTIGPAFYGRIEKMPDSVAGFLGILGLDPTKVIGQWVSVSKDDAKDTNLPSLPVTNITEKLPSLEELNQLNKLRTTPILLVRSIEKTWKDTDGHTMVRVRARVNPALVSGLLNLSIAQIKKDAPDYAAQVKKTKADFAKIQQAVAGMQVAVNVDQTNGYITRLEIGGTTTQPTQACTTSDAGKETCHTDTIVTVRYAIGISLMKDSGTVIAPPAGAIPFKDLFAKPPEPPMENNATETSSTTSQ